MERRKRLILTVVFQLAFILLAKGVAKQENIVVITNSEEQFIDESGDSQLIPEAEMEDGQNIQEMEYESPKRVRRQAQIQFSGGGGGLGVLSNIGASDHHPDFSVTQDCYGVTINWVKHNLPYSTEYKYVYKNSDFKHYNIYRSNSFFTDVTGMKPYKSGKNQRLLRMVQTDTWKDVYPPTNVPLYYTVTKVDGNGNEPRRVQSQKIIFYGAIRKDGRHIPLIPNVLRGEALHHSLTYNPNRDQYLLAFDWDYNHDGRADHLYAMRLSNQGQIVGGSVLNFTATIPGWVGGEQGWPSASYNPRTNEFFVLFHFRSFRHFGNVHVILGQRIRTSRTVRAASPSLVAKAQANGRRRQAPVTHPTVIYNPKTGGYVATVMIHQPRKDVFALFLTGQGKLASNQQVCSFRTDAYEPNLWWDSKREEVYFTCQIARQAAVGKADFQLQPEPYLVLLTKKNATGANAASVGQNTKHMVGYTNKRYANTRGYYNPRLDRLVLFWENSKNGRHTISTAAILVTRQRFTSNVGKWYNCPTEKEVRTPVVTYMSESGSQYMIWQEKTNRVWNIGGYRLQGNLNIANREQREPAVVYNTRRNSVFVVWQEVVSAREVVLFGQHVRMATAFSCRKACRSNERCAQQDICISTSAASNPCSIKNGGCSHTCSYSVKKGLSCTCPADMELSTDSMTCRALRPCKGQGPIKDALGSDLFCGRGLVRSNCPKRSYCHVHPADQFAKCCPDILPSYSLYVATRGDIWEFKAKPTTSQASFKTIPVVQGLAVIALAYDPVDKRIYWSDVGGKKISRSYMNGQGEETIVNNNILVPDGLTLDTVDRKIYWTDTELKSIERADLDGSNRNLILSGSGGGLDKPRAIVLYRRDRFMFWTDWGAAPKISRAGFDGTNIKVLVSSGLGWPNSVVIDGPARRIYWADAKTDKLESCDFNGNGRKTYPTSVGHPFGMALLNERLFWSDWETGAIHSVDKNTGTARKTLVEGLEKPMGIFIYKRKDDSGVPCPDPGIPGHGGRNPPPGKNGLYQPGSKVLFTCNPDHNLIGVASATCQKSGKWNKMKPECIAPPVFTSRPLNNTIDEGASVTLRCSASGVSARNINWIKDGKIMPRAGNHHIITLSGSLIFMKTFYADKGFYTCEIRNRGGVIRAKAYLKIRGTQRDRCGEARFQKRARILGGHRVTKGSHPWQAMLWNKRKKKHFCGASLISERWLVTAAHCVHTNVLPSEFKVRLGKHIRKRKEASEQSSDVETVMVHPHYNPNSYDSDVALIQLKDAIVYTDYVQPICLPSSASDFDLLHPNVTGTITGWGSRKASRRTASRLQEAEVPIIPREVCKRAHPQYVVTGNMFCAGYKDGTRDACQGDSGGPFAIENPQTNRTVLIGIISWGDGCGKKGKYGVYTRITNFVDWIFNSM